MTSVRDATFALLRERGMTTVFGNPGSTELGFLRDFPADFRYVLALHEGVAVGMADGFAQARGRPAFVNLHSACGVGNAMGAVVNAFHNRAPLVITAGNQDRRHLASEPYLFARSRELMAPYVKRSEEPARAADVPAAIDRAWQLAQAPPAGPVFISVPVDDWDADAAPVTAGAVRIAGRPALDELAALVERSRAPVIVAGGGIDRAGAWDAVVALAEHLGAPVWAAPQAPRAGFPEDHALFRGHLAAGHATAAGQLAGADLALVLGAPVFSFLPYEPGGTLPPLAHVTDDPDEAARAPAVLSLVADVGPVASGLRERLAARDTAWPPARPTPDAPPAVSPISPAYLMAAFAAAAPPDAVIVEESPSNRSDFRRHVRIRRPASFYTTASGGLGFAMPAAVGIKLANPARPVLCLVGDGSALYGPQALWSAVRLDAPVVFVVADNARYAILDAVARFAGLGDVPGLEIPGIDFVALARSFGCRGVRVEEPGELAGALADALADDRPAVIDVAIDPAPPPLLPETP
jgi:benzoylformate decarboxylase